ncbi:MAG: hypothetical protein ACREN2_08115 [Candidatus Dormibacteria bacterium]
MELHDRLGFIVTLVALAGALAAIGALLRPSWMPAVRLYLRLTLAVIAAQVLIGIVLVGTGHRPAQGIHWFYGAAMLLAMPIAFSLGARLPAREQPWWVVGGAVATVLLATRALATG